MKKYFYHIAFVLALGTLTTACDDHLDKLNVNPNGPETIDDAPLFAKAANSLLEYTANTSSFKFGGQYSHSIMCGGTARTADGYTDGFDGDYNGMGSSLMDNVIRQTTDALAITADGEGKNELRHALISVVEVMAFSKLTDMYGDIPYFEGGHGKEGNVTPTYDSQAEIYDDMVARLASSIDIIQGGDPANAYPNSDPFFDNDMDKWARLANSFRLRLALRMRNADPAKANAVIAACFNKPFIETVDQNATFDRFETVNPWFDLTYRWPELKVSTKFLDQLQNTADPRLPALVAPDANGGYRGITNGISDTDFAESDFGSASNLGDKVIESGSKLYFMTAAEVWLLRAEAALLVNEDTTMANTYFQNGLQASFDQWDVDGSAFLAGPHGSLAGSPEAMTEQIDTQIWVALAPDYLESWFSIRRTGYPVIEQRTGDMQLGVTNGVLPSRFLYSTLELSTNKTNVEAAIANQGANKIDTKLWWDKQ